MSDAMLTIKNSKDDNPFIQDESSVFTGDLNQFRSKMREAIDQMKKLRVPIEVN